MRSAGARSAKVDESLPPSHTNPFYNNHLRPPAMTAVSQVPGPTVRVVTPAKS